MVYKEWPEVNKEKPNYIYIHMSKKCFTLNSKFILAYSSAPIFRTILTIIKAITIFSKHTVKVNHSQIHSA